MYSRGDANLLNWHHHGNRTYVVDFEFSGHIDIDIDAADHIWISAEPHLGINQTNRTRFNAAQRTIALRWLAVLWKQRHTRAP